MCFSITILYNICVDGTSIQLRYRSIKQRSKALVAVLVLASITSCISLELDQVFGGFLEVLPGALGAYFQTTVRVSCPAVMTLVEKVVWIRIVGLLGSIVARSVELSLTLESLGRAARQKFVRGHVPHHVHWYKNLHNTNDQLVFIIQGDLWWKLDLQRGS